MSGSRRRINANVARLQHVPCKLTYLCHGPRWLCERAVNKLTGQCTHTRNFFSESNHPGDTAKSQWAVVRSRRLSHGQRGFEPVTLLPQSCFSIHYLHTRLTKKYHTSHIQWKLVYWCCMYQESFLRLKLIKETFLAVQHVVFNTEHGVMLTKKKGSTWVGCELSLFSLTFIHDTAPDSH